MNTQELQGHWTQIRGQVKERWGNLTDDDLAIQGGTIDQLIGKIQQRTGESREEIERFLDKLASKTVSGLDRVSETAQQYAQQAASYMDQAGERFRAGSQQAYDAARERYEMAEDYVRSRPSQSIATAFGIGLVVGVFIGLATRSR